jgi:selenocysteine-specific elongation factor
MTVSRAVVGVIGHVDHGKTALVRALTGQETDRLAEEQRRGISIALGFAHLEVGGPEGGATVDLIDMPGHERFVRTMIAGATGLDAVLLVVAADEGLKPQTEEHVAIAGLLGLRRAVVAVTKSDLADAERVDEVGEAAVALLRAAGIAAGAVVVCSAVSGAGVEVLGAALGELAGQSEGRSGEGLAFLPVDRAFAITGHGPVVTGTLRGAALSVGEVLALHPGAREVRVRALQVHGRKVEVAAPGSRVAVNLRGVEIGELAHGMALAAPGTFGASLGASEWLTLDLRSVAGAPVLKNGMSLRWLAGTAEGDARLRLLEGDKLEPGARMLAQVRLGEALAIPAGERVVLRLPAPVGTVAGGRVLEPVCRRRRRGDAGVLARLAGLRDLAPGGVIAGELVRAGVKGVMLGELSRLTALAPGAVVALLAGTDFAVSPRGMVLPQGEMERRRLGARVDPGREAERVDQTARLGEAMRLAGLMPPTPKEIAVDPQARAAAERLLREGVIVRCTDRDKGKELYFHREAIAGARAVLGPVLAASVGEGGVLVSEICAMLGISRKFAMPLLDHLDTIRFTRRVGDRRVLG